VPGKGSRSEGCRGAEHGQTCTKYCTGTVAVRAALELAVQLGRGDEVNDTQKWPSSRNVEGFAVAGLLNVPMRSKRAAGARSVCITLPSKRSINQDMDGAWLS
jgi:hypothetical protein